MPNPSGGAIIPEIILPADTRANQPAPADAPPGALYSVSDEGYIVERNSDDQTAWEQYSPSASAGAGITELVGDVTAGPGSGSQTATIAVDAVSTTKLLNDAVTYAKIQNISAASRLLGRGSAAGAGDTEEITLGSGLSMSGTTISSTGSGGTVTTTGSPANGNLTKFSGATSITNTNLTGDVTTTDTLATTIANDAVTYAKIQNISAASRLLGRGSAGGSGDTEEITLGTGLTMTSTTLAVSGQPYDIVFSLSGAPGGSTTYPWITLTRSIAWAANFSGSAGTVGTNPTATWTADVKKNGSAIGTVAISTGGVVTFTTSGGSAQSGVSGDRITLVTPAADATLADIAVTIAGTR